MGFEVRPAAPEPQEEQPTLANPGPTRVRYESPLYQPTWEDLHPNQPPRGRPLADRMRDAEIQDDLRALDRAEAHRARRHRATGYSYAPDNSYDFWPSLIFGGWYSGGWYDDFRMARFVFSLIFMGLYMLAKLGGCS